MRILIGEAGFQPKQSSRRSATVAGAGAVVGFKSTQPRLAEPPSRFTSSFSSRSFKIPLDIVSILHYVCIV